MQYVRFHVETGPASLFERVHQVFDGPRRLRLHAGHLADRAQRWSAPLAELELLDPQDWELVLVEVRADTGKFVNTTWRRPIKGRDWWVVVGYRDTIRTVYPADPGKRARGRDIVTEGEMWQHVAAVNQHLVDQHHDTQDPASPTAGEAT